MAPEHETILIGLLGFGLAVMAYIGLALLQAGIERFFGLRLFQTRRDRREEELTRRLDSLEQTVTRQESEIAQLRDRNEFLIGELQQAGVEIAALRDRQQKRIADERRDAGRPVSFMEERPRILGIWPVSDPPISTIGERVGIYNAGYDYIALTGHDATRAAVIRELDRFDPHIIEIGAHGSPSGIELSDGITPPGWWGRVARRHHVRLAIVLACYSDNQQTLNVADSLQRAGVPNVIGVADAIADADAVAFAGMLYDRLGAGDGLQEAVDTARLAISQDGHDMIRLRQARRRLESAGQN